MFVVNLCRQLGRQLHHCSKTKSHRLGQCLHACLIKKIPQSDIILSNHLLNMYAKCNDMDSAHQLFDEMPDPNLVTWSAIISGYHQSGDHAMALQLFSVMDWAPNDYVYASALSACAALKGVLQGSQIHALAMKSVFGSVSFVVNSLISMYMTCGCCDEAFRVLSEGFDIYSVATYNALITGFAKNKRLGMGFDVFKFMHGQDVVPDQFTFVGVLGICKDAKELQTGMEIHCMAVKLGVVSVAFVGNVILEMYHKCSLIEDMEKAFRDIEEKDVISWNTIIKSCSLSGDHAKGLRYFEEMTNEGIDVSPGNFTFASVLACSAGIASIHHGKQIHAHIIRKMSNMDIGVYNALVNMYAKCGSIGCAIAIFKKMAHHNLISWNTIIAALGNHGHGRRALHMFEEMKMIGVKPDSVTFIGLLGSCNHAGLVDEGESCFNVMEEIFGISPKIEHLSCLIDLLGKAGRLKKAKEYLEKFPFGNDSILLGSLLSACRLHGDVAVGEWAASRLMELQPISSSPYVLLSNLYASRGKWDGAADTRKMLKSSGVKKEPGYSLVEVKGVAEKFTVGDFSHSSMQRMKDILETLNWEVSEILS